MPLLNILYYPDKRLRTRAQFVDKIDDHVRQLVADMFETMYAAPGIGLAATQVNVHQRIIVMDISEDKNQPIYLINPEILSREGVETMEEGCLSFPGINEPVERFKRIRVRTLNQDRESHEMEAEGLLSVCIQHEMDHLEGKLFVDYLTELKRQRIRKKMQKQQKHHAVVL